MYWCMHMSVDVNNNTCFQKQICRLLHTHTKSNSSYVLGERDHPKSNSSTYMFATLQFSICLWRMDSIHDTAVHQVGSGDRLTCSTGEQCRGSGSCRLWRRWSFSCCPILAGAARSLGVSASHPSHREEGKIYAHRCNRSLMLPIRNTRHRSTVCSWPCHLHVGSSRSFRCLRYTDGIEPTYINKLLVRQLSTTFHY